MNLRMKDEPSRSARLCHGLPGGADLGLRHDLRNLLASLGMIAEELQTCEPQRTRVLAARLHRLAAIAETFCQVPTGRTEEIRLEALAEEVFDAVGATAPCSRIRTRISARTTLLFTDRTLLFRVLFNLVQNAMSAAGAGGGSTVALTIRSFDGAAVIDVSDDGPGLDAELADALRRRFDVEDRARFVGSGLWNAMHLANSLGGRLDLIETSRRGTTFQVGLPR